MTDERDVRDVRVAHEIDVAWLIAVWFAVHGGDPPHGPVAVDQTTVLAAEALVSTLSAAHGGTRRAVRAADAAATGAAVERVERRLRALGVELVRHGAPEGTHQEVWPPFRDFSFEWEDGVTVCVELPAPAGF